ncbi:MAG: cytochrome b/b6 domain-containing protein [Azospirillaceae bacterium]
MTATASAPTPDGRLARVWDPLLRVLHWGLAGSIAVAYVSGEDAMTVHLWAGLAALGVVATRVVWGLIGPRTARFGAFVPTPMEVVGHVRDMLSGRVERHAGHSPVASVMVIALMLTVLAAIASGLLTLGGGEAFEELHEVLANAVVALVGLHVAGVIVSSIAERQNLARAMVTGHKKVDD